MYWNTVYNGALGWSGERSKFGAHVFLSDPHRLLVFVFGGKPLAPADVQSPYIIRVAIALLMVAASMEGRSIIRNATPIKRAHPHFVENLRSLGANVEWVESLTPVPTAISAPTAERGGKPDHCRSVQSASAHRHPGAHPCGRRRRPLDPRGSCRRPCQRW